MRKLDLTPKTGKTLPKVTTTIRQPDKEVKKQTLKINHDDTVILTVANYGYLELLINFCRSLKNVNPARMKILLIITFDLQLIRTLESRYQDLIGPENI